MYTHTHIYIYIYITWLTWLLGCQVNPECAVWAGMDAIGRFSLSSDGSQYFTPTEPPRPLWIARVFKRGEVLIGKAAPHISNGNVALIAYKGKEIIVKDFEVLVATRQDKPPPGVDPATWDPQYGPDLTFVGY